jgi:RNA polymerase sigma-70 factor, ECF subfamily
MPRKLRNCWPKSPKQVILPGVSFSRVYPVTTSNETYFFILYHLIFWRIFLQVRLVWNPSTWSLPLARYVDLSPIQLIRICIASNDERAWTEFIRRFQVVIAAAVLRTASQLGEASRSVVDDLIQDVYLKLCENDGRLLRSFQPRGEDSIYGFLKVVAANVVYDHFKSAMAAKRGAHQTESILESSYREPKTGGPDTFELVSRWLELEQVDRVLMQVTAGRDQERKRAIFWLRHQRGLTASEIAAIPAIGLTTEGVESVLMRLRIMIRSQLLSLTSRREVKVLSRQSRSKRVGN